MNQPAAAAPTLPRGAGPHSIKRHGTTLATRDSEPVQTPGCSQAHGALLALRRPDLPIVQAIVHKLVQRHGGRDGLDSVLGEGATFCFRLPGVRLGAA